MNLHDHAVEICRLGASFFERSLTFGRTGNISVRVDDQIIVTPTGSSLGALDPGDLSVIDLEGRHTSGAKPSKEAFLHAAMYRSRPGDRAVVHTHSTHSVAVSVLDGLDDSDVIPPLTAYYAMRVGKLPRLPYFAPGDQGLGPTAEKFALDHHALLLAHHGPIVSAGDLAQAADALEELEETAKLFLLLHGRPTRMLDADQVAALRPAR